MSTAKKLSAEDMAEAERLLERVQNAQSAYWEALSNLENHLDLELDGTRDFSADLIADLLEEE